MNRQGFKNSSYGVLQQRRREEALARQKHARIQQFNLARIVQDKQDEVAHEEGAHRQLSEPSACCVQQEAADASIMPLDSPAQDASKSMANQGQQASSMPGLPQQQQSEALAGHYYYGKGGRGGRGRKSGGVAGTRTQRFGAAAAADPGGSGGAGARAQGELGEGKEHPRVMFARQLQHPEWLTDVPQDLAQNWLVLPRPEGQRCLVITSRGKTVVRGRTGAVLCMTSTGLPEGSYDTAASRNDFCVLDAIWHEPDSILYICDVLVWRGYSLVDCAAEFRAFWLSTKLNEDPEATQAMAHWDAYISSRRRRQLQQQQQQQQQQALLEQQQSMLGQHSPPPQQQLASLEQEKQLGVPLGQQGSHQVQCVPPTPQGQQHVREGLIDLDMEAQAQVEQAQQAAPKRHGSYASIPRMRVIRLPLYPANAEGIVTAYGGNREAHVNGQAIGNLGGLVRDGLLFMHKEGRYESGAVGTPLVLQWKDAGCSKYPVDTAPDGSPLPYQVITLEYRMDSTVSTSDAPPVVLGVMPQQWVQAMGPKLLRPGRLLKFSVREGGIMFAPDGRPAGAALSYEGCGNQRRGRADAFNKVLFQQLARTSPITLQHLLQS